MSSRARAAWLAVAIGIAAPSWSAAQVSFEQTVEQLSSKDPGQRMRAVQLLKAGAYPESAVPLAAAVVDEKNEIQLEAIAAELNVFLADKITPRRRVGLIVEVRGRIAAESIYTAGPAVLGSRRVPIDVAHALIVASRDDDSRVATEAVYALGSLGGEVVAKDRPAVLAEAAPILAGLIGANDPVLRFAAVRVAGHLFARRPGDPEIEEHLGDAVIAALNDREAPIRETAMWSLGELRYERSIQGLRELFRYYRKGELAEASLSAIARIGHPSSLPEFVEQLSAKHAPFRVAAIEGIARAGDRSRAETVRLAMGRESDDAVLLASHLANVLLADGAIDVIIESINDQKLHDQAVRYLRELTLGRTAVLGRFLQDPDIQIRLEVIEALGLSGDPAAIAVVRSAVADKDPDVQRAAGRALARLGTSVE